MRFSLEETLGRFKNRTVEKGGPALKKKSRWQYTVTAKSLIENSQGYEATQDKMWEVKSENTTIFNNTSGKIYSKIASFF